jgi:signal transduction histidine kinase
MRTRGELTEPALQALEEDLHRLRHLEYDAIEQLRQRIVGTADVARAPLLGTVAVAAVAELVLGWSLSRGIIRSLRSLREGADRIAREHFEEPVARPPEPEFAELGAALNNVMSQLAASRAEQARLHAERLGQVVRSQEQERARVSRELHDQVGQSLTALTYGLDHLQKTCRDDAQGEEVRQLVHLSRDLGSQLGALARDLRPSVLDDLGLVPALRSHAREFSERIGIPVDLLARTPIPRLTPDAETAIFRVVQEALTNVAKHAHASRAGVMLSCTSRRLTLRVWDDGRGFQPGEDHARLNGHSHLGLIGMTERVQLLGGELELTSIPGRGTRISVTAPIAEKVA